MLDRIEADIRAWDAITDHRTGTDGDHRTAQWLADVIRAAGAEPHLDSFAFRRRVLHECAVSSGGERAAGVPLFDGGFTNEKGIFSALEPLSQTGEGIGVTAFASAPAHPGTRRLAAARAGPLAAIVAYAAADRAVPGLALLNAPRFADPYGPPVLQVATEHGDWLEVAADHGAQALLVAYATIEETTASNVQTTIKGRDASLAPLVIMTPCSAWWTCTAERGGGIALWLECIRRFANDAGERDVIFTANTGHELGHVGLSHYLACYPELVRSAHAWIHLGANFAAAGSNVRYQASPDLMQLGLDALATQESSPETITPHGVRPGGEAGNIHDGGGRYLSLLGDNRWFHHPDDRWPDTIDLERTGKLARAVLEIVTALARA